MAEKIERDYDGSDAHMTETGRTFHGLLETDLAEFTDFDSTIDEDWKDSFLADIVAAETVVADSAIRDQQVQLTQTVQGRLKAAQRAFGKVRYFVHETFPNSAATRNEFGLESYLAARNSQPKMAQLLDECHKACAKYNTILTANGFKPAYAADLLTIRASLLGANTEQEVFKRQRPKLTEDRIKILNTAYRGIAKLSAAAEVIWADDATKRKQYTYDPTGDDDDVLEYSGAVPAGAAKTIATMADYVAERTISFRNTGTVPLTFFLTATPGTQQGTPVEIGGGATVTRTVDQMAAGEGALTLQVVVSEGGEDGEYEVQIDMDTEPGGGGTDE